MRTNSSGFVCRHVAQACRFITMRTSSKKFTVEEGKLDIYLDRSQKRLILNNGEIIMSVSATESLILDLLEWLRKADRGYEEVMDEWRTSCPGLPVWEDANDRGLVRREQVQGRCVIKVTSSGLALLEQRRLQKPRTRSVV